MIMPFTLSNAVDNFAPLNVLSSVVSVKAVKILNKRSMDLGVLLADRYLFDEFQFSVALHDYIKLNHFYP